MLSSELMFSSEGIDVNLASNHKYWEAQRSTLIAGFSYLMELLAKGKIVIWTFWLNFNYEQPIWIIYFE